MPNTPNYGFPYPVDSDPADVPDDLQALADALDTALTHFVEEGIVDAKGDIIVATAPDTPGRLAPGTTGQVLTVDPATATGLKWAAASGGGGAGSGRLILPVRLRVPRSSTLAGNAVFGVTQQTNWDMAAWDFADAAEGRIYGHVRLPRTLGGTPDPKLILILAGAAAGNVRVQAKTALVGPGDSLNATFPTTLGPTTVAVAAGLAVTEHEWVPTVAAARTLLVELTRFGADGADTMAGALYLLDAFVEVTT